MIEWLTDWQEWGDAIVTGIVAIGTWEFLKWRQRKEERHDE